MQPAVLRALEWDQIVDVVRGFALTPPGAARLAERRAEQRDERIESIESGFERAAGQRKAFVQEVSDWLGRLESAIRDAQAEGSLDGGEDPEQLAFEIEAALLLANMQFVVARAPEPIERARRAIERRLTAARR